MIIRTIFTYFSPLIRKITNLFKHTNIQIAVKTTNSIQLLTQDTSHQNTAEQEKSGIYKNITSVNFRILDKTNHSLQQRFKEHIHYIQHNDPQSAYALHILKNRQEYSRITDNMKLIKHQQHNNATPIRTTIHTKLSLP
jgi:hypothetical protein